MSKKDKYKIVLMAILLTGACFLTYYCHVVLEIEPVFTHLFYIPIFLASFWWKRKGLIVAVFLGALLILSHNFLRVDVATINDYLRAFMFIVIGSVVAKLSEYPTKAELEREIYVHDLGERVKELGCLYNLSKLVERKNASLETIFQGLVEIIPPAWQYPKIACARIIFKNTDYNTANFRQTQWIQSADVMVGGKKAGVVEVYYLEKRPSLDEGPFLKKKKET